MGNEVLPALKQHVAWVNPRKFNTSVI